MIPYFSPARQPINERDCSASCKKLHCTFPETRGIMKLDLFYVRRNTDDPRYRMERIPPRTGNAGSQSHLSQRHPRRHCRVSEQERGHDRPHRHAGRAGARPDRRGAEQHRRAALVGPCASQRGFRRSGPQGLPARKRRHGLHRTALGARLQALLPPARHAHGYAALARGRRYAAPVGHQPRPPHRQGPRRLL